MSDPKSAELKANLHSRVLKEIDLESLSRLSESIARERVSQLLLDLLDRESTPLALAEREQVAHEVLDEVFGHGPIQPLLDDPTVSDILVNGPGSIYVERHGV